MKPWDKQEIEIAGGAKVMAQMPLIVSASRSTDVSAFYSDWFIERLEEVLSFVKNNLRYCLLCGDMLK